jgi:hypothetical protein
MAGLDQLPAHGQDWRGAGHGNSESGADVVLGKLGADRVGHRNLTIKMPPGHPNGSQSNAAPCPGRAKDARG